MNDSATIKMPGLLGRIVGVLLGLIAAATLLYLKHSSDHSMFPLFAAALVAVGVLAPLLLTNVVLTFVYARRELAPMTFVWMWAPLFLVVGALAVLRIAREVDQDAFDKAHPVRTETHVNLSGRALWLDPQRNGSGSEGAAEIPGSPAGAQHIVSRYPNSLTVESEMADYEGARLSKKASLMNVYFAPPSQSAPNAMALTVRPYPDVRAIVAYMHFRPGEESQVLQHVYFHYAERIEAAPVVTMAGSQKMDLWGKDVSLTAVHVINRLERPVARVELDGQTLLPATGGFAPESAGRDCTMRNYSAYVVHRLEAPVKVRWQLAEAHPDWHEAVLDVPRFRSPQGPAGVMRGTDVDLYLTPGDTVLAERWQLIESPSKTLLLRTTGLSAALPAAAPCGTLRDRFSDTVQLIRD